MTDQTIDYTLYHLAKYYAKHTREHQDNLAAIYLGGNLSFSTLRMMDKFVHNVCVGLLMHHIGETKNLPLDDARKLIVCNFPLVISFVHAIHVKPLDSRYS